MSQVVSIRLQEEQVERLKRFARHAGKSQSEMGALFIEEAMREAEFALIEFRDSALGRQAYMKNSTLAVWEVIQTAQEHDLRAESVARYFHRPLEWVKAAFHYYEAHATEIELALEDSRAVNFDTLKRILPNLEAGSLSPKDSSGTS